MGNSYLSNVMIPLMMTLVLGYYAARHGGLYFPKEFPLHGI